MEIQKYSFLPLKVSKEVLKMVKEEPRGGVQLNFPSSE
jgi:hypothetical protein